MKNKLRKDLFDSRITKIVGDNIFFLHKDGEEKTDTYIEYEIIRKEYGDYCGDNNLSEDYLIQVDIFSKWDYTELEKIIEEVLKEKEYRFNNSVDMYEEDTKLFHCAMRFYYKKLI